MKFLDKYKDDEFTCPSCGRENALSSLDNPEVDGTEVYLTVQCFKCEQKFQETYKLSDIKEVK